MKLVETRKGKQKLFHRKRFLPNFQLIHFNTKEGKHEMKEQEETMPTNLTSIHLKDLNRVIATELAQQKVNGTYAHLIKQDD